MYVNIAAKSVLLCEIKTISFHYFMDRISLRKIREHPHCTLQTTKCPIILLGSPKIKMIDIEKLVTICNLYTARLIFLPVILSLCMVGFKICMINDSH